jgi:hypothetical protein
METIMTDLQSETAVRKTFVRKCKKRSASYARTQTAKFRPYHLLLVVVMIVAALGIVTYMNEPSNTGGGVRQYEAPL